MGHASFCCCIFLYNAIAVSHMQLAVRLALSFRCDTHTSNGAYADMAAISIAGNAKGPPEMGFPRFLLAYFLKVNEPQCHFSSGILHKRY